MARTRSTERPGRRTATSAEDERPSTARKTTARAAKGKSRSSAPGAGRGLKVARQVGLVVGMLVCLYSAVALGSYHATDPAFSHTGAGAVQNIAGPAGAWLADVLLQVFGYGAWATIGLGVGFGLRLAGRRVGGLASILSWLVVLWAVLSLGALLDTPEGAPFPAGGLVGLLSSARLLALVGPAGAWIVVLGALLCAAPLALGVDWERVAARVLGRVEVALPKVGAAGLEVGRQAVGGVVTAGAAVARSVRSLELPRRAPADEYTSEDYADEDYTGDDDTDDHTGAEYTAEEPLAPVAAPPVAARRAPVIATPERPRLTGRPEPTVTPTHVGQGDLVEVEWEPTVAGVPERPSQPREPGSVVDRMTAELLLDADDPASWPSDPGRQAAARRDPRAEPPELDEDSSSEESEVLPAPVPPPARLAARPAPAPAAAPAARAAGGLSGSAQRAVKVLPGALESGGGDDGGVLVARHQSTPFELPHLGLLDEHARDVARIDEMELHELARTLEAKLVDFGVKGEVTAIRPGPVITTFEYAPAPGVKISKISSLSDDIAMALRALRVRIVAPIPGKGVVGIEIPNRVRQTVWLRDLFACEAFRRADGELTVALGKSVEGQPRVADLAAMPHLLVGGTTGSGKSVGVNGMLLSMLYTRTPDELKMILIDPKMLEFELYREIPHLLHPVVVDPKLASAALKWACTEMDARYALLSRWKTRNIASFNQKVEAEMADWTPAKARRYAPPDWPDDEPLPPPKKLPYIVVVIDELADLMMVSAKDVEESIIRLAQKARAAGIHLIVATQRPSVNVITGLIKANMPSRIAFQVRTKVDGRTILDQNGAENLLGKGDMLFLPPGVSALERLHGAFVSDEEVRRVTDFLRAQGPPNYEADIRAEDDDGAEPLNPEDYDELYDLAVQFVVSQGKASASMIQREYKIGYNRAARMIEIMEREGVVGHADGARPREVLVGRHTA